jgi:ligand-binding sensor domain-containing protein/serine phosphatase RsbU (regulator of sigma subunit)
MKKIFFTTCYLILAFSILAQIKIPINSSENTRVSNWLITKVSDFKEEQVERILNNTQDFYNDMLAENVKEINLSSYNDVTIALYQLYKEIDYKTTFVASCIIDINSEQLCGFEFSDISMDATLYINSEKVLSSIESNKKSFDYKLKKGENQISLIGKPSGRFLSSFFLNIYNQSFGKVTLKLKDKNNSVNIPYSRITILQKDINQTFITGTNDKGSFWLKPGGYIFKGNSASASYPNYMYKKVVLKEQQNIDLNLELNQKNSINGTIYTLDGKTPHPGIRVELVNSKNNSNINETLITYTNGEGKYNFQPPIGNWSIKIYSNDKYIFHESDGLKTKFNINRDYESKEFKANFFIGNQIKGSFGLLSMFDGMLSNSADVSMTSSNDLLYLGTYNGLSIYDGLSLKSYNYDHGLPNAFIGELFEDSKGYIWIGYGGKGLVKWKDGNVVDYFTTKEGLISDQINALAEDRNGNILIGTSHGLSVYNGEKFKNYNFTNGLGNGSITDIKVFGNKTWIACGNRTKTTGGAYAIGGGLSIFNGENFKSIDLSKFHNFNQESSTCTVIEKDFLGNIWIGTFGGGLLKYDGTSFEQFTTNDGLPSNYIRDILVDEHGLWICTVNGLANLKDNKIKIITSLKHEIDFEDLHCISKSKDGVYFIGAPEGVVVYDPFSFQTISSNEGIIIPANWIRGIKALKYDKDGILWAGGFNGLYKIKDGIVSKIFNSQNSGLFYNSISNIEISKDGSMWMTNNGRISRYFSGVIQDMNEKFKVPKGTFIIDLVFDNDGILWLNTNRGLGKYKNDSLIIYDESDGLVKSSMGDINVGKNNEIIYSTHGYGFSIYDGESFKNFNESNGLIDNRIWDLAVDSKNNYWLALDGGGVAMFDGEKFHNHKISDGLTAGETYSAYVDDFDNIWIGTFGGGVCYYDGKVWNSVDTRDGLLNNLVGAICSVDGNKYWFGSMDGITSYVPKHQTPKVYIENIKTASGFYNSLEELRENKGKILEQTRITFSIKSNSFNTKKEKQKYIVNIIKNGNKKTHLIRTNEFEFIPEKIGKYIIEFQSIDRDMNYSNLEQIEIKVIGPWYKNFATALPFWGFLLLLISISGYSSNKYLSQRRYTAKLKEESRIRLEEKNKEILDSINYAKRIQDAMMTSETYRKSVIPNSFIFFKPLDVVSGDFYWVFKDKQENIFFTVADCTGHGVPGAFMSMIGTSLLNEIIVEKGIKDTNKILDEMRSQIIKSLNQDSEDDQKDGMDISICKLNMQKKTLEFSGAHNPLVIISGNELSTIKGDSQAVGLETVEIKPFTKHSMKLKKDDMIYIYSDGYQDQFGGENGKKYMTTNFKKLLLKISKEEEKKQNKLLEIELANWMRKEEQIDDICIMGVRV